MPMLAHVTEYIDLLYELEPDPFCSPYGQFSFLSCGMQKALARQLPEIFFINMNSNQFLGRFLPLEYNGYQMYTDILRLRPP